MAYNRDDMWSTLSREEKKRQLYEKQKQTLDIFLQRNAISRAQYDKSLGDLTEKMGYGKSKNDKSNDVV